MAKKEIIIIPNENILILPNGIYHDSSLEKDHAEMFFDFYNKFGIKTTFQKNDPSQICALELAALGHFAIIIERNLTILFISNEISKNQIDWMKENYRILNHYDVRGFIYDNEQIIQIEEDEEIVNPLKEIFSIMKKKYKQRKDGDNNVSRIRY